MGLCKIWSSYIPKNNNQEFCDILICLLGLGYSYNAHTRKYAYSKLFGNKTTTNTHIKHTKIPLYSWPINYVIDPQDIYIVCAEWSSLGPMIIYALYSRTGPHSYNSHCACDRFPIAQTWKYLIGLWIQIAQPSFTLFKLNEFPIKHIYIYYQYVWQFVHFCRYRAVFFLERGIEQSGSLCVFVCWP